MLTRVNDVSILAYHANIILHSQNAALLHLIGAKNINFRVKCCEFALVATIFR